MSTIVESRMPKDQKSYPQVKQQQVTERKNFFHTKELNPDNPTQMDLV